MADAHPRTIEAPKPVGSNLALVKTLFQKPELGFFFLLAIIMEAILFLMMILGRSPTERFIALGAMVLLFIVLLYFFSIERRRAYELELQSATPRAVPESMTAAPIGPAEAKKAPDLMTSPDGTFVYGAPPPGWKVEIMTLDEELEIIFKEQGMGAVEGGAVMRPFRAGPLVRFSETSTEKLEYLPGESLMNGRPAMGAFKEEIPDMVRMYSISKHGGLMREMTADHVFAQVLAMSLQASMKVEAIRFAPSEVDGRATLTARGVMKLENVKLDGTRVASAALETRLHVVEHANFVYVIQTLHLSGGPSSETRLDDIESILASFRAASAANAADREKIDAAEADAAFDQIASAQVPVIMQHKAQVLIGQMRRPGGLPQVSERQLEEAKMLESYALAFQQYVPEELKDALVELSASVQAAHDGHPEALAEFIGDDEEEEEEAEPDALVATPQPQISDEKGDA